VSGDMALRLPVLPFRFDFLEDKLTDAPAGGYPATETLPAMVSVYRMTSLRAP